MSPSRIDCRRYGCQSFTAVIDLHSHILPGVDDGARTLSDSLEIAAAAVRDGIEVLAATPHVRDDHPTSAETMEARVGEVRRAVAEAGIPLDVRKGGEIALEELGRLSADELRRFGLGGNPRYLLLEFPYYGWPLALPELAFRLRTQGITPVLAHPERNADVQAAPERLRPLVDSGTLVQVTAAAVDGRIGRRSEETAFELIHGGLAHLLASDAHRPEIREIGMSAAADALGDRELARWLTVDVPQAIVSGAELPERPAKRKRWFGR